ncbi:MAG: hypothetical protein DRI34_07525 [Deltaproteobacteria bacterium]|nr:MAG: hypothetical protein DRI34_07525 [Deltaproteobacteria bacterium]
MFLATPALAQEATIHHGFLFFAGESYTVDEETFGIYEDGHEFADLIKENPEALAKFHSYRTWHITANVSLGLSLAAMAFGGVAYMPGVQKNLPDNIGIYAFAAGGGLLLLSCVFEFISWGQISSAAEIYNSGLMDDGAEGRLLPSRPAGFTVALAPTDSGGMLALGWNF